VWTGDTRDTIPIADSFTQQAASSFDNLVGAGEERRRDGEPERLGAIFTLIITALQISFCEPIRTSAADKQAISESCSDQANAKGLHVKARKKFSVPVQEEGRKVTGRRDRRVE
jgi:hypothetical protein